MTIYLHYIIHLLYLLFYFIYYLFFLCLFFFPKATFKGWMEIMYAAVDSRSVSPHVTYTHLFTVLMLMRVLNGSENVNDF